MIAKYRYKVKEDETTNVNNWNEHFDKLKETHSEEQDSNEFDNEHFGKLKETHSEEQDSNEIDNLLNYAEKTTTNENCQIHCNYQKHDYRNYHRSRNRNPQRF